MNANKLFSLDDLRSLAKKRIPKVAFDYLDGGAGTEANIYRNRKGFDDVILVPEYCRDVTRRSQKVTLFGHTYDAPIGVSPVGLGNLIWPRAETYIAAMAKKRNIPYISSAVSTTTLEDIVNIAPQQTWFQLYVTGDESIYSDLLRRAKAAGIKNLVITVDIPVPAKRLRDLRNDFTMPFKLTPKLILDIARNPRWAFSTLANGAPKFINMTPYVQEGATGKSLAAAQALQVSPKMGEQHLKRIRDAWDGPVIIKGVLSTKSVEAAKRIGANGLIVSNHGGRQLDCAPSAIEALPHLLKAAGPDLTVMLDSGIRSGTDIVKAFASGAAFTFSRRSFMYGVGALGQPGAERVLDIISDEADRTLAQIGCTDITELGPHYLWQNQGA